MLEKIVRGRLLFVLTRVAHRRTQAFAKKLPLEFGPASSTIGIHGRPFFRVATKTSCISTSYKVLTSFQLPTCIHVYMYTARDPEAVAVVESSSSSDTTSTKLPSIA